MNYQSQIDKRAALVVGVMLILAAWGNAAVMLAVAVLGLAVSVLFFRKSMVQGGALAANVGFVFAIVIALITLLR